MAAMGLCQTVFAQQASLHWELRASGLIRRQSRDGKIPLAGDHREMFQFYPNEVFVSVVVGTPFHLYKKKENLSSARLAGFVSAEMIVKTVHLSYSYSSR